MINNIDKYLLYSSDKFKKQREYWLNNLAGELNSVNLFENININGNTESVSKQTSFKLGSELFRKLMNICKGSDVPLYLFLLTAVKTILYRYTGKTDIVVGSPVYKPLCSEETMNNILAIRSQILDGISFKELLLKVRETTLGAYENQDYPLEKILDHLQQNNENVDFSLQDVLCMLTSIHDINIIENAATKVSFVFQREEEDIVCTVIYPSCSSQENMVERLTKHLLNVIKSATENISVGIDNIEILTDRDKKQLLYEFNSIKMVQTYKGTIHELFEEQAERNANKIALAFCNQSLTYKQLNEKSNALARVLRNKGIKHNSVVGIMVDRSIEMFIGILGILKAGGAYLPIDPTYPVERVKYILEDSGASILLTQPGVVDDLLITTIDLWDTGIYDGDSSNIEAVCGPQSIAYVIYTSGTTGNPKGNLITHANVTSVVRDTNYIEITGDDVLLQLSSYAFDGSVFDIFGSLLNGAKLVLAKRETFLDMDQLTRLIEEQRITVFFVTTALFNAIVDVNIECLKNVRKLLFGGERISVRHAEKALKYMGKDKLIHVYGPTETTVFATYYPINEVDKNSRTIPIGKPLTNKKVYILDKNCNMQPIGVAGELYISGVGLAQGYLNMPELTCEKFVPNPFVSIKSNDGGNCELEEGSNYCGLMYRTGDIGRWLPDGNIEFIGRADQQVKIRGYRIELGEITASILKIDEIQDAITIDDEDVSGNKYICSYLVSQNRLTVSEIKEILSNKLPEYMIPAYFIYLDKIPLNANGKVDRKLLPKPGKDLKTGAEYAMPRNALERKMAEIWEEVLGIDRVGIEDNFFDLGGDSIKAIQLIARLHHHSYKLEMKDLFLNPTICALSMFVKPIKVIADQNVVVGETKLTPVQKWFFNSQYIRGTYLNQYVIISNGDGFEENAVRKVFNKLVEHHDALRMVYKVQENGVVQFNRGIDGELFDLRVIDLCNKPDYKEIMLGDIENLQCDIDIENGPLVKLGIFKTMEGDFLLIAIHHLVVDGVSWRILLEDFTKGYSQALENREVKLQDKTDSFKEWSSRLYKYANSKELLRESNYWQKVEQMQVPSLPRDRKIENGRFKDVCTKEICFTEEETERLLKQVNKAYNTEINDILLTALGLAVYEWAGLNKVAVNLEGHGREEVIKDVNVTRTMGWFTSMYPVVLTIDKPGDISYRIKATKEELRRVPNKGIGYGILKYLRDDENKDSTEFPLQPEIGFNYLGQFTEHLTKPGEGTISHVKTGMSASPQIQRHNAFDINGIIEGGRLNLLFSYNQEEYREETVSGLMEAYKQQLLRVIRHCVEKRETEFTPSDFDDKELTIEELDVIIEEVEGEIQKIYPMSSMQEGMLSDFLKDKESGAYFEQIMLTIEEQLDINLLEESFNKLIQRYDIFRTVFIYAGLHKPRQVVLKERPVKAYYEDISQMDRELREEFIGDYRQRDKERGFDLSKDSTMRLAIFKEENSRYRVLWNLHHILVDGWGLVIAIRELLQIFSALKEKQTLKLGEVYPYGNYIKWLEEYDREGARQYWQKYLEGYERNTVLPNFTSRSDSGKYKQEEIDIEIDSKLAKGLENYAKINNVTLSTVMNAIWGVVLQKYNNADDVVFGTVVSGRPPEIEGIESMVGLFINTIPVRVQCDENKTFLQLVKDLQQASVSVTEQSYLSLSEIQSIIAKQKLNLFDNIVVFENYPIGNEVKEMVNGQGSVGLNITRFEIFEQSVYDFHIDFITFNNRLTVRFNYNGLIYNTEYIQKVKGHIDEVIRQVLEASDILVKEICILDKNSLSRLLYDFNDSGAYYPKNKTIYQLFEEQAYASLDDFALEFNGRQMTYKELHKKVDLMANTLRIKGVKPDSIVALLADRSPEAVIGMLGVLKAGGAYLPVDPNYPESRISYMLEDSGASIILTTENIMKKFRFTSLQNMNGASIVPQLTCKRSQIKDLDNLPIPDRSLVDYNKYNHYIGQASVKHTIAIQGTRGCPYNCAYCHKIWPKTHVCRSAEHIFSEVLLYYNMGVRRFVFIDDIFNLNMENSAKFFRMVIDKGLKINMYFPNGVRGDIMSKEYIHLMVEAGTICIGMALESASPRIQKMIGKNLDLIKFRENVEYIASKYRHVVLELYTMHGFPTETEEEALMTLNFIKSVKWFHFVSISILKIYPNTDMAELAMKEGMSYEAIERSANLAYHELPDTLPFPKAFTRRFQTEFLNEYFLNKQRLLEVLPYQMKVMTEDDLLQKYNSYLPVEIKTLEELLKLANINKSELGGVDFLSEEQVSVTDLSEKMRRHFPERAHDKDALRILFLDLSQYFNSDKSHILYDVVEPPLGHMYLLTSLYEKFGSKVHGKIAKSRIDFDSYDELEKLIKDFKPDVIGIRSLTLYRDFVHQSVAMIKQWYPDVPVIAGGPYATSSYQSMLKDRYINLVVLGEGESTLCEIIGKMIDNGGKLPDKKILKNIEGIAFVEENSLLHANSFTRDIIFLDKLSGEPENQSSQEPFCVNKPEDTAYVIYTSGTTGKPKGAMITHQGLVNYLWWAKKVYLNGEKLDFPLYSSLSFDLTVTSVFLPLISGGKLVIYDDTDKAFLLNKVMEENRVDIIKLTPTHLKLLTELQKTNSRIKKLIVGGEQLRTDLAKRIYESFGGDIEIFNEYGPTETVVGCMIYKFDNEKDKGYSVPIGLPANNVQIYLLDRNLNPVADIGVPGELFISGDGVARGYINKNDLTAQKFIENPFVPGTRMYRTGDMAKMLYDSNIEFLGRMDHQVKVHGYRIDLTEIESHIASYTSVRDVTILKREDANGDHYLCAYIVSDVEIVVSEIREYLSKELPEYMIPLYFIRMDKIPLTHNGKVDINLLPEPGKGINVGTEYAKPRNAIEEKIVEIWQEVLGSSRIGINSNFFEIGGDSIKAIQVMARLHKHQLRLSMKDLFANPVIAKLSAFVKSVGRSAYQGIVSGEAGLTPVQKWFFNENFNSSINHYNLYVVLSNKDGFEEDAVRKVFNKLVEHHDALRMVYKVQENGVVQFNRGIDGELFDLRVIDLCNKPDYKEIMLGDIENLQCDIDIENGPLVKLGIFKTMEGDFLLIAIHHLVVDGVSWRILLEDFTKGYSQALENREVKLQDKTDSFKEWSSRLYKYANSKELLRESNYWQKVEQMQVPSLPRDRKIENGRFKDVCTKEICFTEEETERLLKQVNKAYNTEINDILLTALGLAVYEWAGLNKVAVNLEGHGREEVIKDVNVTRTMGWFTSMYPVVLTIDKPGDISYRIKATKEELRRVPNKGIGYGILKYLRDDENKDSTEFPLQPEIGFNYLGQFTEHLTKPGEGTISHVKTGMSASPQIQRHNAFDINGIIEGGRLNLLFSYNQEEYREETVSGLMEAYKQQLLRVIRHCVEKRETEFTPSDFDDKELTIEDLDVIIEEVEGEIEKIYRMSPMQEGILFHSLKDRESGAYFEQIMLTIEDYLDVGLFEESFNKLIERYDIFRTAFIYERMHRPRQVVLKERPVKAYYEDISKLDRELREKFIGDYRKRDKERGFDLSKDSTMRLAIFKEENGRYKVIWSLHHILTDGWCTMIIAKELFSNYRTLTEKGHLTIEKTEPFSTYIKWLEEQDMEEAGQYWEGYLKGYEQQALIPADCGDTGYQKEDLFITLDNGLAEALENIAVSSQVTTSTVFQTLWGIILQKYNNLEDVVFGSVISGRPPEVNGIEQMVGLFINTIPVRVKTNNNTSFLELIEQMQQAALESEKYSYYQLAQIQAKSKLKQDLICNIIAFENYPLEEEINDLIKGKNVKGLNITGFDVQEQTNYDLNFVVVPYNNRLTFKFSYNLRRYSTDYVRRIGEQVCEAIKQVVGNPKIKIADLELLTSDEKAKLFTGLGETAPETDEFGQFILSESEKHTLLYEFNQTCVEYPSEKTIRVLFEEQVERTPDSIAVVYENQRLSYRELNEASEAFAGILRGKGVGSNSIVGILTERSIDMIVGIMAIIKAGGAYLPISSQYPQERIEYMLKDSKASVLVTQTHLVQMLRFKGNVICLDRKPAADEISISLPHQGNSRDLAYVIYTSGSTGEPKGVMIEQRSVVNLVKGLYEAVYKLHGNKLKVALVAPYVFDASVQQIFGSLLQGNTLYIVPDEIKIDAAKLEEYYIRNEIDITDNTPIHMSMLGNNEAPFGKGFKVKHFIVGGDTLQRKTIENFLNRFEGTKPYITNIYGPTECCVDSIAYLIQPETLGEMSNIPIGKPMSNAQILILDTEFNIVPVGTEGEIFISGDCVGRGYLNRPVQTVERFLINPYFSGERMYRTGDFGRWLEDGNIEFMGRKDNMVKIRGYRIELGEIEAQLLGYKGIREAVATAGEDKDGNKSLRVYMVTESDINLSKIREYLSLKLPEYMIPSYFTRVDKMPLNQNGKVDRKRLLEMKGDTLVEVGSDIPVTENEEKLLGIWKEVLGIEEIGTEANFFDLGGDSIKAIQVASRLLKYNLRIEIKDIFEHRSIKELSSCVKPTKRVINQGTVTGTVKLTPIQKQLFEYGFDHVHYWNQSFAIYRKEGFIPEYVGSAFGEIVKHHDALRMVYMQQEDEITQVNNGLKQELFTLDVMDLTVISDYTMQVLEAANKLHASIELDKGPLVKLLLFKTIEGDHLLIIIHHLVVDGVSWRIIFEDFAQAYTQLLENKSIKLQAKTDSFKKWAEQVNIYANSTKILKEVNFWKQIEDTRYPSLKKDSYIKDSLLKDSEILNLVIPEEITDKLLVAVNHAYNTEINDLLLTALGLAVKGWSGCDKVLISMEGHGREDIIEGMDITRTVGWFTSIYPLLLDMTKSEDISYQIRKVKEDIRRIPNKGVGYGILKYLTSPEKREKLKFYSKPEISFNYLGQFDQDIKTGVFEASHLPTGIQGNLNIQREYAFYIDCLIKDGKLVMMFNYNTKEYRKETVLDFIERYRNSLNEIIQHCINNVAPVSTPSDVGDKDISLEDFEQIQNLINEI